VLIALVSYWVKPYTVWRLWFLWKYIEKKKSSQFWLCTWTRIPATRSTVVHAVWSNQVEEEVTLKFWTLIMRGFLYGATEVGPWNHATHWARPREGGYPCIKAQGGEHFVAKNTSQKVHKHATILSQELLLISMHNWELQCWCTTRLLYLLKMLKHSSKKKYCMTSDIIYCLYTVYFSTLITTCTKSSFQCRTHMWGTPKPPATSSKEKHNPIFWELAGGRGITLHPATPANSQKNWAVFFLAGGGWRFWHAPRISIR
jgi:hypothetical protein